MTEQNLRLGIILMIATSFVFALQDGLSRHLGASYSIYTVVMVRFWFFAVFAAAMAMRAPGGLAAAIRTRSPLIQILRGILLAAEIVVMVNGFVLLGLVESHAVFTSYPLLVAALSGPVLREKVGWRRWTAIVIGFVGMMIILQPGVQAFSPAALLPLAAATMFALYGLLTRLVARVDSANVSFFWTGLVGAIAMTPLGLWHWEHLAPVDWGWLLALCVASMASHYMLIRAYAVAEASAIQPFSFLQLVFVTILGVTLFGEVLKLNVVIGTIVVVGAGLFTLWRARVKGQDVPPPPERA